MSNTSKQTSQLLAQYTQYSVEIGRYSYLGFIVFVACLYGLIVMRTQNLQDAKPSEDTVTSQVQASKVPHIDPAIIKQLQSLQDNSVSVQTLFDQARNNPFEQP